MPFRAVNRPGDPAHQPELQRHHLLPRQLLCRRCFGRLFDSLGAERVGFDDFRRNGMLLPATERAALRSGLPLHLGPHRNYNELVIARVGLIESSWRRRGPGHAADHEALSRLSWLQRALRRRLLADRRRPALLSRRDPVARSAEFSELDALAEQLWHSCEAAADQPSATGADLAA